MTRAARIIVTLLLAASLAGPAAAQESYPSRQISLIAPYAAGGSIDLMARILAEGLTTRLNQTVIVENKPGGNGTIGMREVVRARPDGYTLLMGSVGANVTPAAIVANYPFDPVRDFTPISLPAEWSAILVVKKALPVATLAEFIAYAKARPGALNFGTTGYGSFAHLMGEVLMQQTGISMQHVQYKGGSQATADLLSGAIDVHMMSSAVGVGQAENPNLKMLAVASKQRLKLLPNVPTMAEAGVPGVEQTSWLGVFGPPGLPVTIRDRLGAALVAVANDPQYQVKFRNTGFEPVGMEASAFDAFYRAEVKRWGEFVQQRGLKEKSP